MTSEVNWKLNRTFFVYVSICLQIFCSDFPLLADNIFPTYIYIDLV